MHGVDVVVLIAAVVACVAAVVGVAAAVVLVGQVRRLERGIEELRAEAVPLVADARRVTDHAAGEMARVEAVLEDAGSVTATVDSASRLAQRAFASPVVKLLAIRAGTAGGIRRLRQPAAPVPTGAGTRANGTRANGSRPAADRGRRA
jgi:hypothetical protein